MTNIKTVAAGTIAFLLTTLAFAAPVKKKTILQLPSDIIYLTDVIRPGVDVELYKSLKRLPKNTENVNLYVNSPGGSILIGQNILAALAQVQQVTCYIQSAHSMAFVIMTYCDKVVATKHSYAMQHSMRYMYSLHPVVTPQIYQWYERQAEVMGISYKKLERQYYSGRDFAWTGPSLLEDGIAHSVVDGFKCPTGTFTVCKIGLPYDSVVKSVEEKKRQEAARRRR